MQENTDGNGNYMHPVKFVVTADDGSGSPPATLLTSIQISRRGGAARRLHLRSERHRGSCSANISLSLAIAEGSNSATAIAAVNSAITSFVNTLPVGSNLPFTRLAPTRLRRQPRGHQRHRAYPPRRAPPTSLQTPATVIKIGSLAIG